MGSFTTETEQRLVEARERGYLTVKSTAGAAVESVWFKECKRNGRLCAVVRCQKLTAHISIDYVGVPTRCMAWGPAGGGAEHALAERLFRSAGPRTRVTASEVYLHAGAVPMASAEEMARLLLAEAIRREGPRFGERGFRPTPGWHWSPQEHMTRPPSLLFR